MAADLKQAAQEMLESPCFDKYGLSDISNCVISGGDEAAKMQAFLAFVKNPYLFRVGDVGVHIVFTGEKGNSLQSHITNLLTSQL